jgi:hypothetical protein
MPLSCGWNDMNAAFTLSYEGSAGPGSAVTGVHERLCGTAGTAGTAARRPGPFTIKIS